MRGNHFTSNSAVSTLRRKVKETAVLSWTASEVNEISALKKNGAPDLLGRDLQMRCREALLAQAGQSQLSVLLHCSCSSRHQPTIL